MNVKNINFYNKQKHLSKIIKEVLWLGLMPLDRAMPKVAVVVGKLVLLEK